MAIRLLSADEEVTVSLPSPIILIEKNEHYQEELEGAIFDYWRLPLSLLRQTEHRAGTDRDKARDYRLQAGLHGWSGVEDGAGGLVPFDAKLVSHLPGIIKGRLMDAMAKACPVAMPGSATLTIRRIPSQEANILANKHTKRGVLDTFGLMQALLEYGILRWSGVLLGGTEHPYEPGLLDSLPQEACALALEAINAHTTELDGDLKNSMPG